jgi:cytosine/adenosine deaminase-related metal-dependent hydrolase
MTKILLGGGCVLTLGARSPNLLRGDVLIEDGVVTEIGTGLRAREAEQVDATDTIVMPGFVDTHRHAWTSLSRNLGDRDPRTAVPGAMWAVADHYGPDDVYAATLIGALGAAEAGITTLVDWSHLRSEDAPLEAALQAHADAGLRTVFVHAAPHPTQGHETPAPSIRERFDRLAAAAGPMTTIAFGSTVSGATGLEEVAADWALARELGLRIHAHADPGTSSRGAIAELARQGLLDADVTLVHCSSLDDADVDAIAASGAAVSLAPSSVMASGLDTPQIQPLIDRDIRPGLGVDEERSTPGDLFAQMRATISLQHATVFDRKLAGKAGVPKLMSTRDVIRHATVDGARVAGLGMVTGSLEPGKQADIVMLRTDRPNIFPINDPIGAVVWGMDTSNVDWVFVAGRPLMRGGVLEANVEQARDLATTANHRVASAAGLGVGSAPRGER